MSLPEELSDTERTIGINSAYWPATLGPLMVFRVFTPLLLLSITVVAFIYGFMTLAEAVEVEGNIKSLTAKAALMSEKSDVVHKRLAMRHAVQTTLATRAKGIPADQKNQVANIVIKYSDEHGHDPFLLLAVIETESSYRPKVVSHKGAVGLMQIRPFVGRGFPASYLVTRLMMRRCTTRK